MPFDSLADLLTQFEKLGELQRVPTKVDPAGEIGAICRRLNVIKGPAVLFEKVKGSRFPVAGQLLASNRRLAIALETTEETLYADVMGRAGNMIAPRIVDRGPCQDVVKAGGAVDLNELPIVTNNPDDGGRYLTAGHVILKDPELGYNLAIYRMMVRSRNEVFLRLIPNHHGWGFLKQAEARGRPTLPVAVAIGVDPAIFIASQFEPRLGANELEIAGGLRRKPVEMVRCKTIDCEVPAHASIVLECEMSIPPPTGTEGPFGEFLGYTTGTVENERYMTVKAITHRSDPIYHNIWLGRPPHEHLWINAISYGIQACHELKVRFPPVKAAYAPPSGLSIKLVVQVDSKTTYPGMVKNLLAAAMWTRGSLWKEVVVVDDDINLFDPEEVEWAVLTRVQAERDILILPRARGTRLDPSSDADGLTDKILIDATRKKDFKGTVAEPTAETMRKVAARWKEYGFH